MRRLEGLRSERLVGWTEEDEVRGEGRGVLVVGAVRGCLDEGRGARWTEPAGEEVLVEENESPCW